MDTLGEKDSERFGKRAAGSIGSAVDLAGQKLDAAVDYVESAKQNVQHTLDRVRQDGWKGAQTRLMEYTRREPATALLIAIGTGVIVGWLTKKTRG